MLSAGVVGRRTSTVGASEPDEDEDATPMVGPSKEEEGVKSLGFSSSMPLSQSWGRRADDLPAQFAISISRFRRRSHLTPKIQLPPVRCSYGICVRRADAS